MADINKELLHWFIIFLKKSIQMVLFSSQIMLNRELADVLQESVRNLDVAADLSTNHSPVNILCFQQIW